MTPRLHQFAKRLGVGIDVLEHLVAGRPPGLQAAGQCADVAVAQCLQLVPCGVNQPFTIIIENDRRIPARQPQIGLERNPAGGHVDGKQRMAGGEISLMPEIKQRDLLAQQQRRADVLGCHG